MPLSQLADEIIRLHRSGETTPVLVTPACLRLRAGFFVALAQATSPRVDLPLQVDCCKHRDFGIWSLWGDWFDAMHCHRINRVLSRLSEANLRRSSIQLTSTIGRPEHNSQVLRIGWCDSRTQLSPWATPIELGFQQIKSDPPRTVCNVV